MESGRRWKDEDTAKTQWDLPGFLWFPGAELYGIQRIEYLDDVPARSACAIPLSEPEVRPWLGGPGLGLAHRWPARPH
jgi:hypothetical protein